MVQPATTEGNWCPHAMDLCCPRAMAEAEPFLPTLAGPVLEPEAVASYLPHCVAGRGLSGQDKALVKVPLFAAFKLHCSTDHNEDCGLAWGGFIMNRLTVCHVDLELTGRQHFKKLTQGLLSRNGVPVPHECGSAHVKAGKQAPPLVHGGVVDIDKLLSGPAGLIHVGLEVHRRHLHSAEGRLHPVLPAPEGLSLWGRY